MAIDTLRNLLNVKLADLYDMETQIVNALPDLIDTAKSPQLKKSLQEHLEITKKQVDRITEVLDILELDEMERQCESLTCILDDGDAIVEQSAPEITDTSIITAALTVEHFEMAGYEGAILIASSLGNDEAMALLSQSLEEEQMAAEMLAGLVQTNETN